MTDIHTHILPGMDDGAAAPEESLAMLRMEREQGVDTVVLTPHFYRDRENIAHFLKRRKTAVDTLREYLEKEADETLPRMVIGAEVAWQLNMHEWDELPELCIGKTGKMLVELPFSPWTGRMIDQLYTLPDITGVVPVFAHLDRYLKNQKPEHIRDILDLGYPVQIGTDVLRYPLQRRTVMRLLRYGGDYVIATDCHNTRRRPPDMAQAAAFLKKKLGEEESGLLFRRADRLVGLREASIDV